MAIKKTVGELHADRMKMWDASIARHKAYLDETTGLMAAEFVEERACPVCNGSNQRFMFTKEGGTYVRCADCTMVYLNPVLKDAELTEYYRSNHAVQSEVVAEDSQFYTRLYEKGLTSIERFQNPGTILDVGCSAGAFLDVAKRAGWRTIGVELNAAEAELCHRRGHKVHACAIDELSLTEKVNAITLWDVFEHIKDGGRCLSQLDGHLAEGGVIFLQIPSADSMAARILHERCNVFDGLEHVSLYSFAAIKRLVAAHGFEVLSVETVISEVGVINNHLNYDPPYTGPAAREGSLVGGMSEADIHERLLGYKFQLVLGRLGA